MTETITYAQWNQTQWVRILNTEFPGEPEFLF